MNLRLFGSLLATMLLLTATPASGWAGDLTGKDVEQRARKILATLPFFSGEGMGRYRMVVEGRSGDRYERTFRLERRIIRGTMHTRLEVVTPEALAGRIYLFIDPDDGPDAYVVWVPAFEEARRIDGAQRFGALLRSHLTYRDVLGFRMEDVASVQVGADGTTIQCTYTSEDGSNERIVELASWVGNGSESRVEELTMRPSTGGYTRLELLEFQADVSSKKRAFLPEHLGAAGGDAADR